MARLAVQMARQGNAGVRIGLGNNIRWDKETLATDERLVKQVVKWAREIGREIATSDQAREILHLRSREEG